jgi:hypothetical protein
LGDDRAHLETSETKTPQPLLEFPANCNPVSFVVKITDEQLKAICKSHKIPVRYARNYAELATTGRVTSEEFYRLPSEDRRYSAASSAILSQLCEPLFPLMDWVQ